MYSLIEKIFISFKIDFKWLRTPGIPYTWSFLLQKYRFLVFPYLYWDKTAHAYKLTLFHRTVYIPTVEHIAFLQGTFIDHAHLRNHIKPNSIIIDVGAHIGEFALVCITALHAKYVHSIEPVTRAYKLLCMNTPFTTYHAAVGTARRQTIYIPRNTVASSGFRAFPEDIPEESSSTSLDGIDKIAKLDHIDLLKIDVEGMEYDVLMASKKTFQKSSYICIEISLHRPAHATAMETLAQMRSYVPDIQLVRIGTIFQHKKQKQVAVDMLFYNPSTLKS